MARVAHDVGAPGENDTSAVRTGMGRARGRGHGSPIPSWGRGHWGRTSTSWRPAWASREGWESVRRTAAVIAGALLLLAGCNDKGATNSSGSAGSSSAADAAPAQVALSPADGASDVSPVEP